jgi:hypothetical protein
MLELTPQDFTPFTGQYTPVFTTLAVFCVRFPNGHSYYPGTIGPDGQPSIPEMRRLDGEVVSYCEIKVRD